MHRPDPEPRSLQEGIRFGEDDRLAGALHYPSQAEPIYAVLLFSPHPNFAGDMENNVIRGFAHALGRDGLVLRFDYRGIGQSRLDLPDGGAAFDYWEDLEERGDWSDALADGAVAAEKLWQVSGGLPMVAVGYSFGAIIATQGALADERLAAAVGIAPPLQRCDFSFLTRCRKPCLMLSGSEDFVYDADVAAKLIADAGPNLAFERLAGMDHFFRDQEPLLAERVHQFFDRIRSAHAD